MDEDDAEDEEFLEAETVQHRGLLHVPPGTPTRVALAMIYSHTFSHSELTREESATYKAAQRVLRLYFDEEKHFRDS